MKLLVFSGAQRKRRFWSKIRLQASKYAELYVLTKLMMLKFNVTYLGTIDAMACS